MPRVVLALLGLITAIGSVAHADGSLPGTYTAVTADGQPLRLELQAAGGGEIGGRLQAASQDFVVEGIVDGGFFEGSIFTVDYSSESRVEGELRGEQLQLTIVDLLPGGVPNPASRTTLLFQRAGGGIAGKLGGGKRAGAQGSGEVTDRVIARGAGGSLTESAFDAYLEALVFCLQQIGDPTRIDAAARAQFRGNLIAAYPSLPAEVQHNLADAESIWNRYRQSWNAISLDQKKEFAFGVLALAYGEQAAAQALGLPQGGGGDQGGGYRSFYSQGGAGGYGSYASDGECSYFSSEAGSISTCD